MAPHAVQTMRIHYLLNHNDAKLWLNTTTNCIFYRHFAKFNRNFIFGTHVWFGFTAEFRSWNVSSWIYVRRWTTSATNWRGSASKL